MNFSSAKWFHAYARRGLYSAAVAVVCVQAVAQEKLQEVVVTAERREENIQNVPIAITAVTTETLRSKGVTDIHALGNLDPEGPARHPLRREHYWRCDQHRDPHAGQQAALRRRSGHGTIQPARFRLHRGHAHQ
ncbi:MAG: hypothetical protein E6K34_12605 [Gammaproteobacteria bacterium]|nr:MAG: hypothetical protein E6K34_12605 [Gammaproteobacteria bacterium]